MSPDNHIMREVAVCGISNAVFNGLIAWLALRNGPALVWKGEHSFVTDIVATAFLLPLIVALIVISLQRKKLSGGVLQPFKIAGDSFMQFIADELPEHILRCAFAFGLIGAGIIAPATLLGFYLAGVDSVAPVHYAIFKGLWAGAMAAMLAVPMVLVALRETTPAGATGQPAS